MSIFKAYLQDLGNSAEAILGELVAQKQKIIVKHSVNEFEEQEGTVEQPANYWSCLFNSLKRNFITDKSNVDWESIENYVLEVLNDSHLNIRQRFHVDLHLQKDIAVKELVVSSITLKPKDKTDRLFMRADDEFDTPNLKLAVQNWIDDAHYIKELHKQEQV